jgi:glutathione peroxidase
MMRYIVILSIIFGSSAKLNAQNSNIYHFKIDSVAGVGKIDFDKFKGKKILLVNSASSDSSFTQQYRELAELYQIYKDKLVIVVIPTNSFNTEQGTDALVASRYIQPMTYKFPVTKRLNVINPQIHQLYKWLTKKTDNGVTDSEVKRPFYKYLISKDGQLIASFSYRVTPMHPIIRSAIEK